MKQLREIPYLLRITALIFVFNGLYAFVHTLLSLFSPDGIFLDPRIFNIFIALGLIAGKKFWYLFGLLSAGANAILHLVRLTELAPTGAGYVFYFLLGLAIDAFQLYVLLRKDVRTIYFTPARQGES
jgi:hypothetical protein